jgi:hypothetical protein
LDLAGWVRDFNSEVIHMDIAEQGLVISPSPPPPLPLGVRGEGCAVVEAVDLFVFFILNFFFTFNLIYCYID